MKTAIYLRVSTAEQSHDPQRNELIDYCARRVWKDVTEYVDTISGAKFTRTGLDRLMADVSRGRIERVVVTLVAPTKNQLLRPTQCRGIFIHA